MFAALDLMLPYKPRPQTSAHLARRLVTASLGIRTTITPEQRSAERKKLEEAKRKLFIVTLLN